MSVAETTETPNRSANQPDALAELSDADLLDAWCTDKHSAALSAIVTRYSVMVLSVCRRRCRTAADADDAFQSTFLYLALSASKIKRPERLPGWLLRVAQRAAVATYDTRPTEPSEMNEIPDEIADPLVKLTQRHDAIVLDEELANLPDHYRTAMVLHILEGQSYHSLSEILGITADAIRGHVQRGKKLLNGRLRRRGVVPVLAFAAANALTTDTASASQAAQALPNDWANDPWPDPKIDDSGLQSLLSQGNTLMSTTIVSVTTAFAAVCVVAMLLLQSPATGQNASENAAVHLSAESETPTADSPQVRLAQASDLPGTAVTPQAAAPQNTTVAQPAKPAAEPVSATRSMIESTLDRSESLAVNSAIGGLAEAIGERVELPVILDTTALESVEIDLKQEISFASRQQPIRSSLRMMLEPHGLKADVQDDAVVISAEMAYWTRRGIATDRWINQDEDEYDKFRKAMQDKVSFKFQQLPLIDVVRSVSETSGIPVALDLRAIEELGLSESTPVTFDMSNVSLKTALDIMLDSLDLTYEIRNEVMMITSKDAAAESLKQRIYFLEGTGIASGDSDHIINLIQSNVSPDSWDVLGGTSTVTVLHNGIGNRPSIIVSSTTTVHEEIENLMKTLRETHSGRNPGKEAAVKQQRINGGGMGGGGMGGGMF